MLVDHHQDDISKLKYHILTILGDIKQNIDEQFVNLEKCFNEAILDLRAETEGLRSENTRKKHLKTNNHERFSRKDNICIVGMRFSLKENCISKATEYLSNLLQRDVKIERAHRYDIALIGKKRHILVKCSFYQDKFNIFQTAKAS